MPCHSAQAPKQPPSATLPFQKARHGTLVTLVSVASIIWMQKKQVVMIQNFQKTILQLTPKPSHFWSCGRALSPRRTTLQLAPSSGFCSTLQCVVHQGQSCSNHTADKMGAPYAGHFRCLKIGFFHNTQNSNERPRFTIPQNPMAGWAQADSKQKWPLSLAARPAMWEGPETQESARLLEISIGRSPNHGILGRPRIFPFFWNRLTPRFFFRNPSSKVLRKKVARINPSWDKAMFHCWHRHLPIWSRWKLVKFLCECRGWTRKDCLALRIHTQRYVVLMRFFNDPEFGLCMFVCMEDVNESEKIRYTVGQFTHHGDRSATSGASRGAAGRPSGGKIAASSSKLEILTDSDWQIWPMVQWFLYSFHTVRWKPSFLRILFELAATETTSRRVQGHLGLRRQERTKNMSCCFSLPFKCTSLPGFLWKIMGQRQSPMAYHHSPIKHCYFWGVSPIFHTISQL